MINSNFGFTPLKEVWLGDCYPESYYDHLPDEIADPFRQITQWTKEDTGKLQRFLEDRGIVVRRPVFDSIDNYNTKIFIAGNHDFGFQKRAEEISQIVNSYKWINYLEDNLVKIFKEKL